MAAPTNSSEIGRQRQARLTVDGAGRSFARRTYSKQDEILAGIAPDRVRPRPGSSDPHGRGLLPAGPSSRIRIQIRTSLRRRPLQVGLRRLAEIEIRAVLIRSVLRSKFAVRTGWSGDGRDLATQKIRPRSTESLYVCSVCVARRNRDPVRMQFNAGNAAVTHFTGAHGYAIGCTHNRAIPDLSPANDTRACSDRGANCHSDASSDRYSHPSTNADAASYREPNAHSDSRSDIGGLRRPTGRLAGSHCRPFRCRRASPDGNERNCRFQRVTSRARNRNTGCIRTPIRRCTSNRPAGHTDANRSID